MINNQYGKPTHALDLAKKTKEILEQKSPFGVYHFINEESTNRYNFAKKILKIADINKKIKPCKSKELNRLAKRPEHSILINTKFAPLKNWEEALKDYLYERNNFSRR